MSQSSSDGTSDQTGEVTLPESDRQRLLASNRRRLLLEILEEQPTPINLEELAILVVRREASIKSTEPADVDRVAITLHHNHLPKLSALGLVDYDHRAERVRTSSLFE